MGSWGGWGTVVPLPAWLPGPRSLGHHSPVFATAVSFSTWFLAEHRRALPHIWSDWASCSHGTAPSVRAKHAVPDRYTEHLPYSSNSRSGFPTRRQLPNRSVVCRRRQRDSLDLCHGSSSACPWRRSWRHS